MILALHIFNGPNIFADPAFWAAISFLGFIGVLFCKKVPVAINKSLDDRAVLIEKELEEARKLRVEAQDILADYQDKQKNADKDVAAIVAQAQREAESLAAETRMNMKDMLARRLQSAEDRIVQAERQAAGEIRSIAADLSIAAAEKVMRKDLASNVNDKLFTDTLSDLKTKFN